MAIPADTVWEINTTGSDSAAGGGFSIAQKGATGTDLTYPTPTITTFTSNLSAVGTTTLTCSAALFTNLMLGNVIQISGQGFYCIQGFTSTTVVTVDRNLGTFATTSGWVGGALASPGQALAVSTQGNSTYIKAGTYSITSTSANVSGGRVSMTTSQWIEGYQTTRSDLGTAPVLQASGIATTTLVTVSNSIGPVLQNITADGASLTSITGFSLGSGTYYLLSGINCTNNAFGANGSAPLLLKCKATGCSSQVAFNNCNVIQCEAYANTASGFAVNVTCIGCISSGNTGASSTGFSFLAAGTGVVNCVAYGNGSHGFVPAGTGTSFTSCIAESNTGNGFSLSGTGIRMTTCGVFSNTAGNVNLSGAVRSVNLGLITGVSSFFVNAASGNFALNATASAGASARAAGLPGILPRGLTTAYLDLGAAQHADPVKLLTLAGMTGGME